MPADPDLTALIALAAALGWASGIRLYAVVFLTGLAGHLGWIVLPEGLRLLQAPALLWASGAMLLLEFLADKVPLVDSAWDAVHTVIRIPAGAALAAGALSGVLGVDAAGGALIAALAGGTLAAAAHTAKASTRAAVNASPEPFSNLGLSLLEDGLVVAALWLASTHPVAFLAALALVLVAGVLLVAWLWRFVQALLRRLRAALAGAPAARGGGDSPLRGG